MPGNLSVPSLPRDAWEKWCRDGVVCFAFNGLEGLRIFFAYPKDRSVYHVVDFDYGVLGGEPDSYASMLGCTMVDSKIYVLSGEESAPVAVHYCDVRNQLPSGLYDWERGPNLNTHKHEALVFSLAGSIYVLSRALDYKCDYKCCDPFEVLKEAGKKGSKWESLQVSPILTQKSVVLGSCVDEDGKQILILVSAKGEQFLCKYDANLNEWKDEKVDSLDYSFPVKPRNPFVINGGGSSFRLGRAMIDPLGLNMVEVESLIKPKGILSFGEADPYPYVWHLLPLRGGKSFCLLALYTDILFGTERHVRFVTFDLDEDHSNLKRKRFEQKKYYEIKNLETVDIHFGCKNGEKIPTQRKLRLVPYGVCSKVGSFLNC